MKAGPITTASGIVLYAEAQLGDVDPHTLIVPGFPSGSSEAPGSRYGGYVETLLASGVSPYVREHSSSPRRAGSRAAP